MNLKRHLKRMLLIFVAGLVAAALISVWLVRQARFHRIAEEYALRAAAEKEWILDCQTEEGLILFRQWDPGTEPQEQTVVPYFSSIAALGLLSGTVTEEQAEGVRRYLIWYLDHLNTAQQDPVNGDGTVYDHRVVRENGSVRQESTGDYDSVDSYAALFLMVADAYAQKAESRTLIQRGEDVKRVAAALLRTIGENGLSYAKAEYPVQYLMDNAEVCAGLRAGGHLLNVIDPGCALAEEMLQCASRAEDALEALLWDQDGEHYEIGLMEDASLLQYTGWSKFYPDSVAQLFPVCFGVMRPGAARAGRLYDSFCQAWDWENWNHFESEESSFYWCVLAYAAACHGDEGRLQSYLNHYDSVLSREGRGYPLYTGEAGWIALACGHMEDEYRSRF